MLRSKDDGAISRDQQHRHLLLASNLPEYLEVDVAELDVGDSIFLLAFNCQKVEIPALALGEDRDQAVVSVTEAKVLSVEPEVSERDADGEEGEEESSEGTSEDSAGGEEEAAE